MMVDLNSLHEQLPRSLRERLSVYVMPSLAWKPIIAIFVDANGRSKEVELQEDGRLSEISIADLCVSF